MNQRIRSFTMDTLMSTKMYAALKAAGAPEENAQEGASVLGELDKRITNLEYSHKLTHWMVGINITISLGFGLAILSILIK